MKALFNLHWGRVNFSQETLVYKQCLKSVSSLKESVSEALNTHILILELQHYQYQNTHPHRSVK